MFCQCGVACNFRSAARPTPGVFASNTARRRWAKSTQRLLTFPLQTLAISGESPKNVNIATDQSKGSKSYNSHLLWVQFRRLIVKWDMKLTAGYFLYWVLDFNYRQRVGLMWSQVFFKEYLLWKRECQNGPCIYVDSVMQVVVFSFHFDWWVFVPFTKKIFNDASSLWYVFTRPTHIYCLMETCLWHPFKRRIRQFLQLRKISSNGPVKIHSNVFCVW